MSKTRLKGSHVAITGAASGIGKKLAEILLLEEDAHLFLFDKDAEELDRTQHELKALGVNGQVKSFACDITNWPEIRKHQSTLRNTPIDVLVNSAGGFYSGSFENMEMEEFADLVNVDLLGNIAMTKIFLPNLLKGHQSMVVNLASAAGLIGAPGMCAYSAAKFGMVGFSESLQAELKGRVDLLTVCPTFVRTNIAGNTQFSSELSENEQKWRSQEMEKFVERYGANCEKICRKIVLGIKKRKRLMVMNPEAQALYYLNRLSPSMSQFIIGRTYDLLLKRGVIHP